MNILIRTLILFIPFVLLSCSNDSDNESTDTNKTYKVRYEVSCDNSDITLRILYSTKNTDFQHVENDAKEVFVKSPFSVELEMNKNEVCYISVQQEVGENEIALDDINYSTSILVDGVKKAQNTNKTTSISYLLLNFE